MEWTLKVSLRETTFSWGLKDELELPKETMEEEDCYRQRKSMCRTLELERNLAQAKIQKLFSVAEPNVGPDKAGETGRG